MLQLGSVYIYLLHSMSINRNKNCCEIRIKTQGNYESKTQENNESKFESIFFQADPKN